MGLPAKLHVVDPQNSQRPWCGTKDPSGRLMPTVTVEEFKAQHDKPRCTKCYGRIWDTTRAAVDTQQRRYV